MFDPPELLIWAGAIAGGDLTAVGVAADRADELGHGALAERLRESDDPGWALRHLGRRPCGVCRPPADALACHVCGGRRHIGLHEPELAVGVLDRLDGFDWARGAHMFSLALVAARDGRFAELVPFPVAEYTGERTPALSWAFHRFVSSPLDNWRDPMTATEVCLLAPDGGLVSRSSRPATVWRSRTTLTISYTVHLDPVPSGVVGWHLS